MGILKIRESSGGAEFEVEAAATPRQLKELGELSSSTIIYDSQTQQKVDDNTILVPGHSYGNTVQATLGM